MFLKKVTRIEGVLFLYFVALLVRALIEREIRRNMEAEELATLPLYPEDRDCAAPTAERILSIFAPIQRHGLVANGEVVQTFEPHLTALQLRVLKLLGLSPSIYARPPA